VSVKDDMISALEFLHPRMGKPGYGAVELCAFCPGGGKGTGLWSGFAGGKEGIVAGWFDTHEKLAKTAMELDAGWRGRDGEAEYPKGLYITLQPCDPALMGRSNNRLKAGVSRTSDKDVGKLYNILIDVDAKRPSEISASHAEKELARKVTRRVKNYLMDDCFWPEPLIADSGNGGHLVFKLFTGDVPAAESSAKVKELLAALDSRFRTTEVGDDGREIEVGVDTTVYNPARLVKLWGTWARKGDATKDRPHRESRVKQVPDPGQSPVTLAMIDTVLGLLAGQPAEEQGDTGHCPRVNAPTPRTVNNPFQPVTKRSGKEMGTLDVQAYLDHYQIKVLKTDEVEDNGSKYTRWCLDKCVFDPSHSPNEAFIGQTDEGKVFYRCFHASCQQKKWKDARSIISGEDKLHPFMLDGGGLGVQFPHVDKHGKPFPRYENFMALCDLYGVEVRYNVMGKHEDVLLPDGLWEESDRLRTLARDYLEDLCGRHGLAATKLDAWMRMLGEVSAYHPAREWIEGREWDGTSRFEELLNTVKTPTPNAWRTYLRRWLIQAVAALYEKKFSCRGVLTFTGAQGVGKTSWFKSLMPESIGAFSEGQSLDPDNKDSVMIALSKWVVELGEIDSTFKKADISKLKAFLTKDMDILRVPYGRAPDHWRRMTVFGATVNDPQFLVDGTGNTRWWCIESTEINWRHGIDMQQLWAEARGWYEAGESWFLNEAETAILNVVNKAFEVADPLEHIVQKAFMFDTPKELWTVPMTAMDVLEAVGFDKTKISRSLATTAGVVLKKLVGSNEGKRVNKRFGYYYNMPLLITGFDVANNDAEAVNNGDWLGVNGSRERQ